MQAATIDQTFSITRSRVLSSTVWIGTSAALTAVGAQIVIPTIPVPFTLQTFFVLLSGALLGARKGAAAQLVYLALGAVGLPVFAGYSGSFLHLIGPTGGYLLAFPVAAYVTGALLESKKTQRWPRGLAAGIAMTTGMLVVFLAGVTQLNVLLLHNWNTSLTAGFLNLQLWDALKIAAAAGVYSALTRRGRK